MADRIRYQLVVFLGTVNNPTRTTYAYILKDLEEGEILDSSLIPYTGQSHDEAIQEAHLMVRENTGIQIHH